MGATNSTQKETTLNTPSRGSLRGITQVDRTAGKPICSRYTKIPYALPPTGARRWRRPVALLSNFSFNDPITGKPGDYTEFGDICPQPVYAHSSAVLENEDAVEAVVNKQSEDCSFVNVWVPEGEVPEGGWAVQIYLHGGWLQVGDAMQSASHDPFDLMKEYPRIIVSPTYRLNIFGFLSSPELAEESNSTNFGFWDQRLAIEWVHANISLFGGNPDNLTVGGLSAGANSTIFQLHYDTYLPPKERLIKRVFLFSNAVGIQPKSSTSPETQSQFNELLSALNIPLSLPGKEKLAALREIPSEELISKITTLKQHTFRPSTDEQFISSSFLRNIHDGSLTTLLASHKIKILLGEVANEEMLYRLVNPATSLSTLSTQLNNYYPSAVTSSLLSAYPLPLPSDPESEWGSIGGRILGDAQVHAVIRGFTRSLLSPPEGATPLPLSSVLRYRIEWRAKGLDKWLDPNVLCCHACDIPIWSLSGRRAGFEERDEVSVSGLLGPFHKFLRGEDVEWGVGGMEDIRCLRSDGTVVVRKDELWDEGLRVWGVMAKAQGL